MSVNPTILYYLFSVAAVVLLDKIAPSGPCSLGLGFLAFLLLVPISAAVFLKDIFYVIDKREGSTGRIVIHLLAFTALGVVLFL